MGRPASQPKDVPPVTISSMFRFSTLLITCSMLLAACSPKYDWREVRGNDAPFVVTMPAKPATHAREVNLDGVQVLMTMTAAEIDNVTFAVGTAELPDATQAQKALAAMKTALVKNINGTLRHEKSSGTGEQPAMMEIEAIGLPDANRSGEPYLLLARFIAQDKRVYQLLVVGKEKSVARDAAETFFTSFKLN